MELSKSRRGNNHMPLGCRFVPYDQWFLTHIPPTWKIRHLKQHILAKCLHLPWDARKIEPARDADVEVISGLRGIGAGIGNAGGGCGIGEGMGRPPSPITFAPEERERPISPIEFASPSTPGVDGIPQEREKMDGESWEEVGFPNNEMDDDEDEAEVIPGGKVEVPPLGGGGGGVRGGFIPKPLSKLAASSSGSSIPFSPLSSNRRRGVAAPPTRVSQPYGTRPDEQIHIEGFTLVRFTTGQILEDDYSIAWYQLAPHELVELHASRLQRGFSVAVHLTRLLEVRHGPAGALVLGSGSEGWWEWEDLGREEARSPRGGGTAAKDRKGKGHAVQPLSLSLNSFSLSTANNVTPQTNNANQHEISTSTNTNTATIPKASVTPYSVVLTSFARHDLNSYIQPYWEGWVRCLRVVWRPDIVSSGVATGMVVRRDTTAKSPAPPIFPYPDYSAGFTSFSGGMGSAMVPPLHAFEGPGLAGVRAGLYGGYGGAGVGGPFRVEDVDEDRRREREEREREKERERRKRGQKLEWRERWVVIRDGWVYLCRDRDEPNPKHRLPLAGLLSLRGVEHLTQVYPNKDKGRSDKDNAKDKDKDRRERRDREDYRRDKDRDRERERPTHRRSTSTPRAGAGATSSVGGGGSGALGFFGGAKDRERDVGVSTMPVYGSLREKGKEREKRSGKDRERQMDKDRDRDHRERDVEKRRKAREREERELDYLRRWDEIPIGALFGKGKEKEKEREREREKVKEKEREKRERYKEKERAKDRERARDKGKAKELDARSRSRSSSTQRRRQTQSEYSAQRNRSRSPRADKGKDRAKDNNKERDTITSTSTRTQSRTSGKPPDPRSKTYIPYTRDEAEAAGMKILCAKFKSAPAWEREQKDREARRAILRARMEGRVPVGGEGAMASTTSFGSSSTLTLTLAGGALSGGGAEGKERERERRYTSTGPSLAAALASFVPPPPPPGVVAPLATAEAPSEGMQGHKSSVGVFEMDALHPQHSHAPPPPTSDHHHPLNIPALRRGSLPGLGGLGKLVGAGGTNTATDSMVGSPLTTNVTPGSSGSGSGGGKFSMGLFGVGKDKDKDKEDEAARATRKREERERKEREKRQKAIDKDLKKERKRREGGGDWDDEDEVGSSSSWRLSGAGKRWGRGTIPTPTTREDNVERERMGLLEKMEPITFAPMPVKKMEEDEEEEEDEDTHGGGEKARFSKSVVSIPATADSATLHDMDYVEPLPSPMPSLPQQPTATPTKPKLHVSTSSIGADAEIHTDSDSCSVDLSSPVFAHSTDSEDEDFKRPGYRYGGYHAKEKDKDKEKYKEKEKEMEKAKGKTKDVVDVDKAEEKPDAQVGKEAVSVATPVRRKEVDRGEWVILDMGNDHAFNSMLRLLHRHCPPPLSSTFVSDVVEETPLSHIATAQNPTQDKTATDPKSSQPTEEKTTANEDDNEDNDDDDDIYHTTTLPHPPVLTSIHPHLPNPLPPANPALPYPEWRTELVHRARRHGMREEGRALDLALHGWGREFEEMEQRSGVFKKRRRKEEEGRKRVRMSFVAPAGASGQDEEEVNEEEDGKGKVVDPKRMSEASHVSTLNAAAMNAASATAASSFNNPLVENKDQKAEPRISKMPSSSSSDAYTSSQRISIDTFLTSESSSNPSSSESETEWVAWHTDLPRQRIALQAAKRAERERERQRRRERMHVLEEEERERVHRVLSLRRQPSTSTLPEAPLSPLMFSNPFAGNSLLEDYSPLGDGVAGPKVVRMPSTGAGSLHPSVHASLSSNSSSDHQLPPRTQEEERRRYLETRRALEPSATSHITITTMRSMASSAPSLSASPMAFSSSSSSILNQPQHPQLRMVGSASSLGSTGRSPSPSSISSANVHAHTHRLRSSVSFQSQLQQRSRYGEHVRSPSGGRVQVLGQPGSPSVESFGGYWSGMGSNSTPTSASVSVSNSPSLPSIGPSWAPRTEFSTTPNLGAISIAVDVVSSSSVSTVAVPPYPVAIGHSSSFGSVMDGNNERLPFAPSSPTEDPRQRRQQPYDSGSRVRDNTSISPPPLPPMPISTSQHFRTHSRSPSGTSLSSHVPYRVTVSGAGHVEERSSDREEGEGEQEENEEEEEEQVARGGDGGTLPIQINAPPLAQFRGGGNAVHERQSPRSPPPLSTMFTSRASPKSPSSPSRPSPSPSTTPNHPSSNTNTNANVNTNTVAMPILTKEQINQIESETEERLMRIRMGMDVGGLPLPPSPGGFGLTRGSGFNPDIDGEIGGIGGSGGGYAMGMGPRRSSSAGLMSTRSSPGAPRLNPGTNTTASSLSSASASASTAGSSTSTLASASAGLDSSGARPASIMLGKSYPFPPSSERERERRVLRKRPSDLGTKAPIEIPSKPKGSTAPPTPTKTIPGSGIADSGSPGKKYGQGQAQRPKLSLSGPLSSPSSSAGGGRSSPTVDAQSPTFARYGPSVMRSSTTPTASTNANANARSFSGISSPPANASPYPTSSSSAASNSDNPNASIINTQTQPSQQASAHGNSTMASAKALLRRVRSGSSLKPGMGVHPEEEADGVESFGSVTGAAGLGDSRSERGSGARSKGAMMERIARGLDSGF